MATNEQGNGTPEAGRRAEPHSGAQQDARFDIRSHVAQTLIEAMEKGETPWQRPWSAAALRPMNATSQNQYRGVNRVLLSLAPAAQRGDNRWVTYAQANAKGWRVRKGERGTMIVKVVELEADGAQPDTEREREPPAARAGHDRPDDLERRKTVALRRYFVFNATQVDGMPPLEESQELAFDPVERAEAVLGALKEKTGLLIVHGGSKACYMPELDEVRLPPKKKFASMYDMYAVAFHEVCHSTMHPTRLDRKEAYAKRWGDEAYALEELTVEIASAVLCSECGISERISEEQRAKHLANHVGYLQSWIKAVRSDPMAIFAAAKAAERVTQYVLALARQATAMQDHAEWVAAYETTPAP